MKRFLILITLLTSLLTLTACAAAAESPTPTASPSPTATATVTPSPTATATSPTPSNTPEAADISLTDTIPDAPIFNGYLFAPYDDPECQLPCWQGLVIGESGRDDVQEVFARLTGIEDYDFFEDYEVEDQLDLGILEPISLDRAAGYEWLREPGDGLHALSLIAIMDENQERLEGLWIDTGGDSLTPQYVLMNLGAPSNIYVSMNWYYDDVRFPMIFVYSDKGLAIFFYPIVILPLEEKDGISYATYCLNDVHIGSSSYIVEPFENWDLTDVETLPIVFKNWIGYRISSEYVRTIESVTDLTIPEIVDLANSEENACIDIQAFD